MSLMQINHFPIFELILGNQEVSFEIQIIIRRNLIQWTNSPFDMMMEFLTEFEV